MAICSGTLAARSRRLTVAVALRRVVLKLPSLRLVTASLVAAIGLAACTHDMQLAPSPPLAAATTTTGPWASMIFAARTDSGVIVIDLGWVGAEKGLRTVLGRLGATPADVRWAFLTHTHRDHIAGWPKVQQATFVLGNAEVPFFTGTSRFHGFIPRIGDRLLSYRRPKVGEIKTLPLASDTLFVLGRDTLRAFLVPGHTAGSTVYLFRETLFVGDAANYRATSGFGGARSEYSDSVEQSRASMASLLFRLDSAGVRWRVLCTAHGKCGLADSTLRAKILQ